MNPWHDVAVGEDPERLFHCVVEVPRGSKNKYELDKATGLLRLDRVLYSAVHYPANYGFLPRTYCEDGDPLDVLILCQEPVVPLTIMRGRPIGVITMTDEEGRDDKIIAVAVDDPEFSHYDDIRELPPHRLREIQQFLKDYKSLEGRRARVGPLRGSAEAARVIRKAIRTYRETIWPSLGEPEVKPSRRPVG
ncbi:MAG TPA: inorganic diphosphatase [Planctomycetota bacterium]|jgi:inorganic pyrophosphatase|nr:inorganic diphosphatase [Planctomycetota bacterium]